VTKTGVPIINIACGNRRIPDGPDARRYKYIRAPPIVAPMAHEHAQQLVFKRIGTCHATCHSVNVASKRQQLHDLEATRYFPDGFLSSNIHYDFVQRRRGKLLCI
jgi:hypothetical protein